MSLCPLCQKPLPAALTGVGNDRQIIECSCGAVGIVQPHSADVRAAIADADASVDKAWRLPSGAIPTRSELRGMIGTPGDDDEPTDAEVDAGVLAEILGLNIEHVEQAGIGADALVADLIAANKGAHALLSIALLPLIASAAQLRNEIRAVLNAVEGN